MSVISTFSPVSSLSSNGLRMCVCACLRTHTHTHTHMYTHTHKNTHTHTHAHTHTHTHKYTHTHTHTHYDTHILIPFEDRKPMGLKVDMANMSIQSTASSSFPTRLSGWCFLASFSLLRVSCGCCSSPFLTYTSTWYSNCVIHCNSDWFVSTFWYPWLPAAAFK